MLLLADVVLSESAITLVTTVVGTLWGALLYLWRTDDRRRERERAEIIRQRDSLLDIVLRHGLGEEVPKPVAKKLIDPTDSGAASSNSSP